MTSFWCDVSTHTEGRNFHNFGLVSAFIWRFLHLSLTKMPQSFFWKFKFFGKHAKLNQIKSFGQHQFYKLSVMSQGERGDIASSPG